MAPAVKVDGVDGSGGDADIAKSMSGGGETVPLTRDRKRTDALLVMAVRGAQAGDRDAFAFLYARFADDVHRYLCGLLRDPREAGEIAEHVFAELTQTIGEYEEKRETSFYGWILRLARDVAFDRLRRRQLTSVQAVRLDTDGQSLGAEPDLPERTSGGLRATRSLSMSAR